MSAQPAHSIRHRYLSSPEAIVDEARNGRMFILVDDEDRENEGDLIVPAQMATPEAINFMATHGRGLICLALTRQRVEDLGLEPMSRDNREQYQTAFTVSIEAREGVTTGISAADRAQTVSVASDATYGRDDIVTPGHIFPLMARDGGVLVRAGHTEAAVDVARLAGLRPAGVICEIMNDDGTMARLDDLIPFAKRHGLKIGTIRDLIRYRRRHDRNVERIAEREITTRDFGNWRAITFRDRISGNATHTFVKGAIVPEEATLVRVHRVGLFPDVVGAVGPREGLIEAAMAKIDAHGSGVLVLLADRLTGDFLPGGSGSLNGGSDDLRDYGVGAQILADLGVQEMMLLANSHHTPVALAGYGLHIVSEIPLELAGRPFPAYLSSVVPARLAGC
jgi:3,4-dihydroxy 2-butanone 4-phosphate synthase/GTP cyclohydrolase II